MKRMIMVLFASLCTAWGDAVAVQQFVDKAGYVYLQSSDPHSGDTSYAAVGRWSDSNPPSSGNDYLVQEDRELRIPEFSGNFAAADVFAGRSLTLDNGRIKGHFHRDSGQPTATINDLRIYGGRIEVARGGGIQRYAGNIRIFGTADVPSRFSMCSQRTLFIDSTLTGDADNLAQVMMTEGDAGNMNANYFGECWFTADNAATYHGAFRVIAGSSSTGYGHKIALGAASLASLGAGDPAVGTSVLTLKDRTAFIGERGFAWTNPAYSIAIDGSGTFLSRNAAGTHDCGLELGGGVSVKGVSAGANLYTCGNASTYMNDVVLSNIGRIVVEENTLRIGPDFSNAAVSITVNGGARLSGEPSTCGAVEFLDASTFSPSCGGPTPATLTIAGGTVNGVVTGQVSIVRADGVLSADCLKCQDKLLKGSNAQIVFDLARFPSSIDWEGRVRLLSAPNLGESDSFTAADFEMCGLPADWMSARPSGVFQIVEDEAGKHLEWVAELTEAATVRIMPLGDTITYGSQEVPAGYREYLRQLLIDGGYKPDFVGTLQTDAMADPDHEGHVGVDINALSAHVESCLTQLGNADSTPHIILLHVGTKDLEGTDFIHAADRLAALVDRLGDLCPAAWVVVTTLLDRTDESGYNEQIRANFNPHVAGIVASRRRAGLRTAFVDLNAAVPANELAADGVCPNDTGYRHMAAAWFGAIQTIMPNVKVAPSVVRDDIVTLTGSNASGTTSWDTDLQWSTPHVPQAGYYYSVPAGTTMRTPEGRAPGAFAGEALVFDGGYLNLKGPNSSAVTANWVLDANSRFAHGNGAYLTDASGVVQPYTLAIDGTMDVYGTAAAPFCLTGSGVGSSRRLVVRADLTGGAESVVRISRTPNEVEDAGSKNAFICEFTGDNSAYRGRFVADRNGQPNVGGDYTVNFASQAALGAPSTQWAKVSLSENFKLVGNVLAFTNGYSLAINGRATICPNLGGEISGRYGNESIYFGQGGTITGTESAELVFASGSGSAICLDDIAIQGVDKIVSGVTLRIYPGYDNPLLPIESTFRLAVGSDGVGPVTVKSGGDIQPGYGTEAPDALGTFGLAALTVEAGAKLTYTVVEYNGVLTSDFIRVYGNITKPTAPIQIVCDRYPNSLNVGTAIPLLAAANLGTEITANDFSFTCMDGFLAETITGAFEIRDVNGTNTLFFVQSSKPVVFLSGVDANGNDCWAHAKGNNGSSLWSDGLAPHAGSDYVIQFGTLLRRSMGEDGNLFAGDSLSINNGGDLAINGLTAIIEDLRLFSGGILTTRSEGAANRLQGVATVYAVRGNPFNFEIETDTSRT